ncbi:Hsp20/alpha crystallin family protein [Dactylosporangium roseum]|uniref:Hsp20/alpha crystallin family protein n=1 Tax=Dactylosporangium roseum TaxID=47989 RepID=A0ABY5YXP4_9ACTN|nr:Hsp20/alpha crystallin family protein [Dactylosporangium roseum]UWZ34536.1 Hsp20/alpha crystallin family protein [Dactylosporangium roseum]
MQTLRFDPFRDFDRLAADLFGTARTPSLMPMDCLRTRDAFVCRFDLPGIDADSLDVSAENNTLTVKAERHRHDPDEATYLVSERPSGTYSRQLVLGDGLSVDDIRADYRDGVLTLTIPVAERAKPRKIEIARGDSGAIGSHGGHKMISGETGHAQKDPEREQVAAAR